MSTDKQITTLQLSRHPGYLEVTVRFEVPTDQLGTRPSYSRAVEAVSQWIRIMTPWWMSRRFNVIDPEVLA